MSSIPYSIEEVIRLFHKYNIYIVKRRDFKNQDFLNSVNKLPIDAAEFIRNELTEEDCVRSLIRDRDYQIIIYMYLKRYLRADIVILN